MGYFVFIHIVFIVNMMSTVAYFNVLLIVLIYDLAVIIIIHMTISKNTSKKKLRLNLSIGKYNLINLHNFNEHYIDITLFRSHYYIKMI